MNIEAFSKALFVVRKGLNFSSRNAFAENYGWHFNTIRNYEIGTRTCDIDYLAVLAHASDNISFFELLISRLELCANESKEHNAPSARLDAIEEAIEKTRRAMSKEKQDNNVGTQKNGIENKSKGGFKLIQNDDSMAPAILRGAEVIYYSTQKPLVDGHIYVIEILGNPILRRANFKQNGDLVLSCDNKNYNESTVSSELIDGLNIIGKASIVKNILD